MSRQQAVEVAMAGVLIAFIVVLLAAITQEILSPQYVEQDEQLVPADSTDLRKQLQSVQFEPTTRENDE
jgi:hypothetical protein